MAINYFIGWTREDLEEELRIAQEDLAGGKSTTRAGAGDANTESRVEKSIESRIQALLKALNLIDPVTYPIGQVTAIDRTRLVFNAVPDITQI